MRPVAAKTLESPAGSAAPPGHHALQRPATGTNGTSDGNGPPFAFGSVYAPDEHRTCWWLAYICPWCGRGHIGRARDEAGITGRRKARCGRLITVLAARTYRGQG